MGHLARRQKVLPSLVSHEISASISLLSTSLHTWETPVIGPSSSLFFLSCGRSRPPPVLEGVQPAAGGQHPALPRWGWVRAAPGTKARLCARHGAGTEHPTAT